MVAGAAVLAAVLAGRLVMQDRALALATAQLAARRPRGAGRLERRDRTTSRGSNQLVVADGASTSPASSPAAAMLFREASIQRRLVNLRAADDLGRYVRLVSGRLPTRVRAVALRGAAPEGRRARSRRRRTCDLIEVGRAVLKPDAPFAPFVLPTPPTEQVARAVRYHTPQPSPIVIANGVAGLSNDTELADVLPLVRAGSSPLGRGDVHPWAIDAFARQGAAADGEIEASSDEFQVTAPTDTLAAAASSSRAAARRLLLLGGEGGALLLAFTILAAAALRRDVTDARRRLTWFGARRWQVELLTLAESLVARRRRRRSPAGCSAARSPRSIASRAGSPAGEVVEHALLSAQRARSRRAAVAVAAGLLLYATVRAPGRAARAGSRSRRSTSPRSARSPSCSSAGRAARSTRSSSTGGGGTSAFLLLVPALIVFAAAVVSARLLAPALRALGRAGRRGPVALRLAAASLARNPGHAAIAATFLVASLGLALFAVAYRSTLPAGPARRGARSRSRRRTCSREDLYQLVPCLHGAQHVSCPARRRRSCGSPATSRRGRRSASSRCRAVAPSTSAAGAPTSRTSRSRRSRQRHASARARCDDWRSPPAGSSRCP